MANINFKKVAEAAKSENNTKKEGNTAMIHKTLSRLEKMIDEKVKTANENRKTVRGQLDELAAELSYLAAIERKAALDGKTEQYKKTKEAIKAKEEEREMLEVRLKHFASEPLIDDREHKQAVNEIHKEFEQYEAQCRAEIVRLLREALDLDYEFYKTKNHADAVLGSIKKKLCYDDSFDTANDMVWVKTLGMVKRQCTGLLNQLGEPYDWKEID